jgi:hypothetical protein
MTLGKPYTVRTVEREGQSPQNIELANAAIGEGMDLSEMGRLLAEASRDEIAQAHTDIVRCMAFAGMSKSWGERYAAKKWRNFAPKTELGRQIHEVVTQAVAKAKAARETT